MPRQITILHLSDLHISSTDFSNQSVILEALWKDLRDARTRGTEFDLVFFTGDLIAKGDYSEKNLQTLRDQFLTPLLRESGLNSNRLFLCPGNHDVCVKDRADLLDPVYQSLISEDLVSRFFQNLSKTPLATGLEKFHRLVDEVCSERPVLKNDFYRAHTLPIRGINVGICTINSSWKATGAPNDGDHGKLIIGRHQLEELVACTKDSSLTLALFHHPPNWLAPFDYDVVQRQLYQFFDGVFYGHNHHADGIAVAGSIGSYFASNAGCLYQKREYFNGYSVVAFDVDAQEWMVVAREYFEDRREFDQSTRFAPDGKRLYKTTRRDGKGLLKIPSSEFISAVAERANSQMLSNSISDVAPKTFQELFVEPPISQVSQRQLAAEKNDSDTPSFLTLKEVMTIEKPVIFVGPRDSGKTVLLHRLCSQVGDVGVLTFPPFSAYIDLQNSIGTRAQILESIVQFSGGTYTRADFIELMRSGLVVICFDNLSSKNARQLAAVVEFVREFRSCRFFLTYLEDIEASLSSVAVPDIGVEAEVLYLHFFGRKETRALTRRWFGRADPGMAARVDEILQSLGRFNIPRSPFLISAMLWIKETQANFNPVNQSAVMDALIDGVLQKLTESKARSSVDSTIKRHYLSMLAERLCNIGATRIAVRELDRFTLEYFESRGLPTSTGPFLEELRQRGMLIEVGGYVGFKFDCMRAFFLSERMKDSPSLLAVALSYDRFPEFAEEIDYLTGAQRDRRDVLVRCLELVEKFRNDAKLDLELSYFDDVSLHDSPFDEAAQAELTEKVFGSRLLGEQRERALDRIDGQARIREIVQADASRAPGGGAHPAARFAEALLAACKVLRNSELIDDVPLKESAYKKLVGYWCEMLIAILVAVVFMEEDPRAFKIVEGFLPVNNKGLAHYFLKILTPNVVFSIVRECLGTGKLELIIANALRAEDAETARRVLDTFLYLDLDLPDRFVHVEDLMRRFEGHRFVSELIFVKLGIIFVFMELSGRDEAHVRRLLARSINAVYSAGNRVERDRLKNRVFADMERKRLATGLLSVKNEGS